MEQVLEGLRKKPKPLKQQDQEVKFKTPKGELREISDEMLNEMLDKGKTADEIETSGVEEPSIIQDKREENMINDFSEFMQTLPRKVTDVKTETKKAERSLIKEKTKEKNQTKPKQSDKAKTTIKTKREGDDSMKIKKPKRERITERVDVTVPSKHEVFSMSLDEDIIEKMPKKENLIVLKKSSYYLNNREVFINYVNRMFQDYRKEILEDKSQMSCDSKEQSEEFKLLTHQKIVRQYINLYSPYRGLLIYHGLGSGKTCTSIAVAETFQQIHSVALAEGLTNIRKVVVMTPASLRTNFWEELKKCGDLMYRKNQYWKFTKTNNDENLEKQLSYALGLAISFIKKNNGAWFVDVNKEPNFDNLSGEDKISLDKQLDHMIHHKYTFINYNGLRKSRLDEYTQNRTRNPFDNKVIIIDEAHNFVSRIVNKIESDNENEPEEIPTRLYKLLLTAENARVVLLTGTPMINYPNEIGILFNILRGYIKSWIIPLVKSEGNMSVYEKKLKTIFSKHQVLDTIEIQNNQIIYTRNPFNFINKYSKDKYRGIYEDENLSQVTDAELSEQVLKILQDENIRVDPKKIKVQYSKALPDKLENFQKLFIEEVTGEVQNTDLLKRRILGLTSYFRSAQEGLMPSYDDKKDLNVLYMEMSSYQYEKYEEARLQERRLESKKPKNNKKDDLYKSTTSSYRIFSRAFCNFVFPNPPGRPMPREEDTIQSAIENINDEDNLDATYVEENIDGRVLEDDIAKQKEETRGSTYDERIKTALEFLKLNQENVLSHEGLQTYSPKMLRMLENIEDDNYIGSHLIYSQFRTLEGIGIFKLVLEANGFSELRIKKNQIGEYDLDIPGENIEKGKMFSLYTGTESTEEKENIRNIFNGNLQGLSKSAREKLEEINENNLRGELIKVFMITASGAEGISLKNVRYVHIMEPYWHPTRVNQVIGRARRICSHSELPEEEQNIRVFMYLMKFSKDQVDNMVNELKNNDTSRYDKNNKDPITSDQALYEIMNVKEGISKQLLKSIKEAAIDCAIHNKSTSKEILECYTFGNETDPKFYSYRPNIENEDRDANLKALNKKKDNFRAKKKRVNGIDYALRYDEKGNPTNLLYDLESFLQAKNNPNINAELVGKLVDENGTLYVDYNI